MHPKTNNYTLTQNWLIFCLNQNVFIELHRLNHLGYSLIKIRLASKKILYSNFRKYAHPLHVKEGIITEKVFPVFSESFFGLVLA